MDSFESYDPADETNTLGRRNNVYWSGAAITASVYRSGSQSLSFGNAHVYRVYASGGGNFNNNRAFAGFAWRLTSFTNAPLLYALSSLGAEHMSLRITSGNKLAFYRGGTLLDSSTSTFSVDTWYYVEVKMTVSDSISTDDCILKVNEVEEINLSATTDTNNLTYTAFNSLSFYGTTTTYIDDVYICDDTGSVNNSFLGDCVVTCLRPNGNGNSSDWDGSDGNQVNNYELVDESYPDDTDYIEAQNTTESDLFTYGDLATGVADIKGVQVVTAIQKTSPGARFFKHQCRSGGTTYTNSDERSVTEDMLMQSNMYETDPDTATAWTKAGVDGVEFGIVLST